MRCWSTLSGCGFYVAREFQRTFCGGSRPPDGCHPSYRGACLDPDASDYDCLGGRGNGPKYTGRVIVVGPDEYGLDADGDGIGCEEN